MPIQSTYLSPGYSGLSETLGTGRMMFGLHTQITLSACTVVKMSCTCRHALTYWPLWLPDLLSDHGYQSPFISCPNRSTIGHFWSRTAVANRVMYPSKWPSMMRCNA